MIIGSIFGGIAIFLIILGFMWDKIREEKRIEREYKQYFGRE